MIHTVPLVGQGAGGGRGDAGGADSHRIADSPSGAIERNKAGQRVLIGGRIKGLGQKQLRSAVACHIVAGRGHGFCEVVAAGCRQLDFNSVGGAGGEVAGNRGFTVKPIDISSQTGRGHGHAGVRCLTLNRSLQASDGHAGDGCLGDNNRNCFWQGCCITCCNICHIVCRRHGEFGQLNVV